MIIKIKFLFELTLFLIALALVVHIPIFKVWRAFDKTLDDPWVVFAVIIFLEALYLIFIRRVMPRLKNQKNN